MCLAVPAKIIERTEFMATVEIGGVTRQVSMMLLPEAAVGDYVLVHAGCAIEIMEKDRALELIELFHDLDELA